MPVPKLRFKEFNDDWNLFFFNCVVEKMQSGISRQLQSNDIGYPVLRSNNIVNNNVVLQDLKFWFIQDNQNADLKKLILKDGDLLINFINSNAQIGKTALYHNTLRRDIIFTTNLLRVNIKKEYNTLFIFYKTQTQHYFNYIKNITKPAVNQASFTTKDLNQYSFFLPSFDEQEKIAGFLSVVDQKLGLHRRKAERLSHYKKGIMQKIFSQQIRFKDDEGNEFPEWEIKSLKSITIKISNGLTLQQQFNNIGYPVTRIETISEGNINLNKIGYVITNDNIDHFKLIKGDILFSHINSISHIGKVVYIWNDLDIYHGMNLLRIQIDKKNNSLFCFYQLSSHKFKQNFEKIANKAVNQASINQTELGKIKINLPSLPEQEKIANFLSALDDKITEVQQSISHLEKWKKGLLQQLFI